MATKYSGADWLEVSWQAPLSDLGREVADLLGQVWRGLYHLDFRKVHRADWSNAERVSLVIGGDLSTWDFDLLTRLVVMCHDRCLRLEVCGCGPGLMRLSFFPRRRDGDMAKRHPTMEDAVAGIRRQIGLGQK